VQYSKLQNDNYMVSVVPFWCACLRELEKKRIYLLLLGGFLLLLGIGEWILASGVGYTITSFGERIPINMPIFVFTHLIAILLGAGAFITAFRLSYTLRHCPACQKGTQQIMKKVKKRTVRHLELDEKERIWVCETCKKQNIEAPSSVYTCPKCERVFDTEKHEDLDAITTSEELGQNWERGLYCGQCHKKLAKR